MSFQYNSKDDLNNLLINIYKCLREEDSYSNFLYGRQYQFIYDYYNSKMLEGPLFKLDLEEKTIDISNLEGRSISDESLNELNLGERNSSSENADNKNDLNKLINKYISDIQDKTKIKFNNLFKYVEDLSELTPTQQFVLGRNYQFLINYDSKIYRITYVNRMNIKEISDKAGYLRRITLNQTKSPRKRRSDDSLLLSSVKIVKCKKRECNITYMDGRNTHCEDCNGKLSEEIVLKNHYLPNKYEGLKQLFNCYGNCCMLNDGDFCCGDCYNIF